MQAQRETVGLAKGGEHGGRHKIDGSRADPSNARPTLADAGIDKHLADRARGRSKRKRRQPRRFIEAAPKLGAGRTTFRQLAKCPKIEAAPQLRAGRTKKMWNKFHTFPVVTPQLRAGRTWSRPMPLIRRQERRGTAKKKPRAMAGLSAGAGLALTRATRDARRCG